MGLTKAKVSGPGLLYRLRLPAGGSTFAHGHDAPEYITVLKGAFSDGRATYAAGDFSPKPASRWSMRNSRSPPTVSASA